MRALLPVVALIALHATQPAVAQSYPSCPITLIVPLAAGGPTDPLARIMSERMRASLGQPIIGENVAGASGSIGVGRVARATPDGYTIGIGQWDTQVINGAIYTLQYDLLADFEPIAMLPNNPRLIVSKTALPATNLKDLIGWLEANPGKASQGMASNGSAAHVTGAYFQATTGAQFQFVPYRGAAPAM